MKEKIASAYFTSPEESSLILSVCDQVWGLDGKRVLEPSVGCGNIVRAASPYDIDWVTNELTPDHTNFIPTLTQDFLTLSPDDVGPVDMVIGNPPFTGRLTFREKKTTWPKAFIERAFDFADKVAFILPADLLRARHLYSLSPEIKVVAHTPPKPQSYSVAEISHGQEKSVKTTVMLFEKQPGTDNRPRYDESPVEGLEWLESYEGATHGTQIWGDVSLRALDGSYGREQPYANERPARISDPRIEAILLSSELSEYLRERSACMTFCGPEELNHLTREMLSGMKGE